MYLEKKINHSDWNTLSSSEKFELRGLWGEYYLNKALSLNFGAVRYDSHPDATYFLFDRIHIPSYGQKTTEIDSVLVCQKGIFVFEVKSWSGDAIYGEKDGKNWFYAKSPSKGNIRSSITGNPFGQNEFHIRYLSKVLPLRVFPVIFNTVLLLNASPFTFKSGRWAGDHIDGLFLDPDEVVKTIESLPNVLSGKTVIKCAKLLSNFPYGDDFKITPSPCKGN